MEPIVVLLNESSCFSYKNTEHMENHTRGIRKEIVPLNLTNGDTVKEVCVPCK